MTCKFPTKISEPHAVERLIERHVPEMKYDEARELLLAVMARARLVSWHPDDLNGLGQSFWRDAGTAITITVDGHGLVRTVQAKPPGRCGYIVDNYATDHEEQICGRSLPCKVHL